MIEAAPGAGKTTREPVAINRAEVTGGRMVVVLQPRRVAPFLGDCPHITCDVRQQVSRAHEQTGQRGAIPADGG